MEQFKKEPLFAEERKAGILQLLLDNSKLLVPEICEIFGVSPATARNDLREMENAGLLKRTHGGAISISRVGFELDSYQKIVKNQAEKQKIAKLAMEYVEDGDIIAVDTGTTTLEFARLLPVKKGLTVVLNDLIIAEYLEEHSDANIILTGGAMRRNFHCVIGPIAIRSMQGLSVDKAFIATNGITVKTGLTTPDLNQAEVKKTMIDIAAQVTVLCDSSKIGYNGFVQVAPISAIHRLITDRGIQQGDLEEFRALGIDVQTI